MDNQDNIDTTFTLPRYHTYLLRCWQERSAQANETVTVWRFSLEDARTGQRRAFATLEALLNALLGELVDEAGQK
jgi:hypothetical protein